MRACFGGCLADLLGLLVPQGGNLLAANGTGLIWADTKTAGPGGLIANPV
ncbi:MAG: hypothetical protein JKY00_04730 [Roseicyclus sp.]|nr:hypothetical protein [Roseicyclus sp.]